MIRFRAPLIVTLATLGFLAIVPISQLAHGSNLTFGSVQNLSNSPSSCPTTCASLPRTAAVGSHVFVVWLNNTSGNSNLLFRVSDNNGTSFGPVIRITNSTTQGADKEAMVAVGSDVYIVWQQNLTLSGNSILFRASTNNGTSFGPIVNLTNNISGLATSALPEIAAIANNVYIIWLATTSAHNPANEILFKSSTSNGSNFATVAPTVLSSKAYGSAVAPLSGPQIAALNTHVYAAWIDTSFGTPQTIFRESSDSGATFAAAKSLSSAPAGEIDYDQEIAVSKSNVYVVWTNETSTTNLIDNTMFAASNNNGTNFGAALNFNKAAVVDANPQLAVSGNNIYAVWSDTSLSGNTEVFYRASNNNGGNFGNILNMSNVAGSSSQQTISVLGNNVYIAWVQSSTTSDGVHFVSSSDGGSTFGNSTSLIMDTLSSNPTIAAAGSYAYVSWEDETTGNGDIYFSRGSPGSADVAITAFSVSRNFAYNGVAANPIVVNLTAANKGTITETFNVTAFANSTVIGAQQITLLGGESLVVTFNWHPELLPHGSYSLSGQASTVPGETNLSNNLLSGGTFTIRLGGDVNSDCAVNIQDLATVAYAWNTTPSSSLWNPSADLNNDGQINIVDLANVAINWNAHC